MEGGESEEELASEELERHLERLQAELDLEGESA